VVVVVVEVVVLVFDVAVVVVLDVVDDVVDLLVVGVSVVQDTSSKVKIIKQPRKLNQSLFLIVFPHFIFSAGKLDYLSPDLLVGFASF